MACIGVQGGAGESPYRYAGGVKVILAGRARPVAAWACVCRWPSGHPPSSCRYHSDATPPKPYSLLSGMCISSLRRGCHFRNSDGLRFCLLHLVNGGLLLCSDHLLSCQAIDRLVTRQPHAAYWTARCGACTPLGNLMLLVAPTTEVMSISALIPTAIRVSLQADWTLEFHGG